MHSIEDLKELAKNELSEKRYGHTLAVAKIAKELAEKYNEDIESIQISALLHDIAKEIPMKKQRKMLSELKISQNCDIISDNCIHSILGYHYAKDTLQIKNYEILNGILYHTTGRAGMSLFEKIIYTADVVSYDRDYKGVERFRELAFDNLENCMIEITDFTIQSLLKKRKPIAIDTINCYNDLISNKL